MRCIYCNTPLAAIDYCPGCGADVTLQKRIVRISNLLYNEGLEKALVRDMEGAITCLKRSLKFNKENMPAILQKLFFSMYNGKDNFLGYGGRCCLASADMEGELWQRSIFL